jgi:hypothetical protein
VSDQFAEQPTEAPVLLPIQEQPLAPDDAFTRYEESLDRRPDATDLVVVQEEPPPLGRGWAYDFQRRQFIRSATAHGPLETHGLTTLEMWVEKCLRTARGAHPIYSDDFGIELPADFFGGPVSSFPDDLFRDRVIDALTKHPRIIDVTDFAFDYDPDEEWVAASFTVETGTGDTLNFANVRIGG